jgi:hypothetical protein
VNYHASADLTQSIRELSRLGTHDERIEATAIESSHDVEQ